jgi:hypothetical protein
MWRTDPASDPKTWTPAILAPQLLCYQPCHNPVNLAAKATPARETKNTSKNSKEAALKIVTLQMND